MEMGRDDEINGSTVYTSNMYVYDVYMHENERPEVSAQAARELAPRRTYYPLPFNLHLVGC